MTDRAAVVIYADIPAADAEDLLQHWRAFDASHPDCHFRIHIQSDTAESVDELQAMLERIVEPFPVVIAIPKDRKAS